MTDKPENPQAFPLHESEFNNNHEGMTLRDWFAGQVVNGIIQNDRTLESMEGATPSKVANWSYSIADAMLAERSKRDD
jgi:hypothetical protein